MSEAERFPEAFSQRMKDRLGAQAGAFFQALSESPVVSVRYNPRKMKRPESLPPVSWCQTGVYLDQRPQFTLDPAIHAGCYYVQEASSMFLEQALLQLELDKKKLLALDLCASPGGKTTHLASVLHPESLIVSNEAIQTRVPALRENVIKWGAPNVLVTQNDPAAFSELPACFDLVVVDAPCSGEGLFRKDAGSMLHWSEQNARLCSSRQQRILQDVLPALRPGGILVYSTCTWNEEENEGTLRFLKEAGLQTVQLSLEGLDGIEEISDGNFGYAFYPHRLRGEGFFLSVFRKPGSGEEKPMRIPKRHFQPAAAGEWIRWVEKDFKIYRHGERLYALREEWLEKADYFSAALNVRQAGVQVAEMKGVKAIPSHALATNRILRKEAFPVAEMDRDTAMAFLRKDVVPVPPGEKGWMLATYRGAGLGWLNNLGNRVNNYYPVEWRIRKR